MKIELKGNPNYCVTVVEIKDIIDLEGCDNIKGAIIFGNHVIVSKDTKIGDVGLFFPVETKISEEFLSHNSLYRDKTLNRVKEKAGFFELNGRIRCVKLRGFKSEGFWIPVESLVGLINREDVNRLKVGNEFDHINSNKVCEKYIIKQTYGTTKSSISKIDRKLKKIDKMIEGQFHFHKDTEQLGKNLVNIKPEDVISISKKIHGTSFISSNILCKKRLSLKDRIAKFFGVNIIETEYDGVYSSRKVIKNKFNYKNRVKSKWSDISVGLKKQHICTYYHFIHNKEIEETFYRELFDVNNVAPSLYTFDYFKNSDSCFDGLKKWYDNTDFSGFYSEDIWGVVNNELKDYLEKGMTIYGEIVGYLSDGKAIQGKGKFVFDYGCEVKEHEKYIYRITTTNKDGVVYEWSMLQVQQWCKEKGLKAVPLLYYGTVYDHFKTLWLKHYGEKEKYKKVTKKYGCKDYDNDLFLRLLSDEYLEKDCSMSISNVPDEGIVLRREVLNIESYKLKSFKFKNFETKQNDKGETNIEDDQ